MNLGFRWLAYCFLLRPSSQHFCPASEARVSEAQHAAPVRDDTSCVPMTLCCEHLLYFLLSASDADYGGNVLGLRKISHSRFKF